MGLAKLFSKIDDIYFSVSLLHWYKNQEMTMKLGLGQLKNLLTAGIGMILVCLIFNKKP